MLPIFLRFVHWLGFFIFFFFIVSFKYNISLGFHQAAGFIKHMIQFSIVKCSVVLTSLKR